LNKADRAWTSKTDDFFPYASHIHGFWTGYFTSRPTLKHYERHTNNILQVTRQLAAFANLQAQNAIFYLSQNPLFLDGHIKKLFFLLIPGEAMAVIQHHDAITGTEKQAVAFDYAQRLSDGIDVAQVRFK
jgi:lysosomal alpha-mannosidase